MRKLVCVAVLALSCVAAYASVKGYLTDSTVITDHYGNKTGMTCFYRAEHGEEFSLNYMGAYASCPREVEVQ
jgi:hypothetical protein